jgi:ABC-type transport system involved in cytochrome c biogenesis permease subunit
MNGFALQVALHWLAVALYAGAAVAFTYSVIFDRPGLHRVALWLVGAGLVPQSAALLYRWVTSGHGPYVARFEVFSSDAWMVAAGTLVVLARRPAWRAIGMVAMPAAVLLVGLAVFSDPQIHQIPPTFRSIWLVFHVTFAKLAAVGFLICTAAAVLILIDARSRRPAWAARFPTGPVLEALLARSAAFGLVFWTFAIAAGSIWAHQSWGRYWGWDAIETWSLVAWLLYGALLHARHFFRWSGTRLAWAAVGAFLLFALTALVFPVVFPTIHDGYMQ